MGMETVTSLLEIACALLMSTLIANGLAYQLTEVWRPPFKRKPFTCFGCMAFWLTFFFRACPGHSFPTEFRLCRNAYCRDCRCGCLVLFAGIT